MKRITLFTQKNCAHCKDAQQYMKMKSYPFRLVDVATPQGRKELSRTGARSVPVIKIGDSVLMGWNMTKFEKLLHEKDE
ncbi:glutaredoxin family protein [Photobacterium kishitanii]|uniref:Glutaredoxin family protein n=2 Tax=Photobacterium kishitanii TaxID=318456 RepID=A0A0B7JD57_9GAMM|nr:glutaredoxin family protein [Photobacterium kishitanii]PSU99704.1 glutaredoxin family protein [Photobacterium kishitanii]CEO39332.1 Glutaredoxin family protein [Photobacterium kishitanii]